MADLSHIETWVFDLNNTLYSPECRLFDQIDEKMTTFIADRFSLDRTKARKIQKEYFFSYGTTLAGLMHEHDVKPDEFLPYVHDIDRSGIPADKALDEAIAALPGKKYICTNGTREHAAATLDKIGISGHFEDIYDIKSFGYTPKPAAVAYDVMVKDAGFDPNTAAMFEDIARNLQIPHKLGMTTVLVHANGNEDSAMIDRLNGASADAHYVHHTTNRLSQFLSELKTDQFKGKS